MRVCVLGLWHLGCVTAACLASKGEEVVGLDFDAHAVSSLNDGVPPIFEPGLQELIKEGMQNRVLSFTTDIRMAVSGADLLWVAYDTPVDGDDKADEQFVIERVERVLPHLRSGSVVLISSQLPVGSTGLLENRCRALNESADIGFAYSPENLRLGKAIAAFTQPERIVAGIRSTREGNLLEPIFKKLTGRIEWMSVESAEVTKHAINAFLATSITFINEIAAICERVGADAAEVERGLKSEARIGPKAYLSAGGAFAGGTLARDVSFLLSLGAKHGLPTHLLKAIPLSNGQHRHWAYQRLNSIWGDVRMRTIAVWGLTYKPGTNTLRRSNSVELCRRLSAEGATVRTHDPVIKVLPGGLGANVILCETPLDAIKRAEALVLATEWPEYGQIKASQIASVMQSPIVLDASRFLRIQLESDPSIRYFTVGKP